MNALNHRLPLLLSVLLLCGCGAKSPPVARSKNKASVPATGAWQPGAAENAADAAEVRKGLYQGKTPAQWGEGLQSSNIARREEAGQALRNLGEAGYSQLVEGLRNPVPEVRLKAMQVLDIPLLVKHQDEMVPLMMSLLRDPNPIVREQAAMRLAWFDSTGANQTIKRGDQAAQRLQALQFAAQNDPAPNVRLAAVTSMQCIQSAMSGRIASD